MPQIPGKESTDSILNKSVSISWRNKFIDTLFLSGQRKRFVRFGISGLTGLFVNMGTLYTLREFENLGLTRSAIIAIELAIINNFFWNDLWTFQDVSSKTKGLRKRCKRFLKFNLICLSGLILNVLIINTLYNLAGTNAYLANLIAIAGATFWNFWLNLKISWKVPVGILETCPPAND